MSALWLALIPLLVTWLPAGYLASRVWNALGLGCEHFNDQNRQSCPRNHHKGWDWDRPFKSDDAPTYFGLGVVLGWIMVALFVWVVMCLVVTGLVVVFFEALGRRLMPKQSR